MIWISFLESVVLKSCCTLFVAVMLCVAIFIFLQVICLIFSFIDCSRCDAPRVLLFEFFTITSPLKYLRWLTGHDAGPIIYAAQTGGILQLVTLSDKSSGIISETRLISYRPRFWHSVVKINAKAVEIEFDMKAIGSWRLRPRPRVRSPFRAGIPAVSLSRD